MSRLLLCLDFDGVIHQYSAGWQGHHVISDAPVPGVGRYILNALVTFDVAIYSSRSSKFRGRQAMKRYVRTIMEETIQLHPSEALDTWRVLSGDKQSEGDDNVLILLPEKMIDGIFSCIQWPWLKPAAFITIDDRAITFNGKWDDPKFDPDILKQFQPWNKKTRRRRVPNG